MTLPEKLAVMSLVLGLASVATFAYAVWEGKPNMRTAIKRWLASRFDKRYW